MVIALIFSTSVWAQETIATMETTEQAIRLQLSWEGNGAISANGVTVTNNQNQIFLVVDGKISLVTTGNVALTYLNCSGNRLTNLDVTKCTVLTELNCSGNRLTNLDVSECTALTELDCSYNQLTNLDVTKNTALTSLNCGRNQLTNLDVSECTILAYLYCHNNQLTNLDVSECTALMVLYCNNNQLTNLDVSECTALMWLLCENNQLTNLDVSECTALTELVCDNNQLTDLDIKCTALMGLWCNYNQLTSLNVSNCTALTELYCYNNQLTDLDVTKCTRLRSLGCYNNQLTDLDVTKCTALMILYCYNNRLTALDVTKCTALTLLFCHNNQLTNLDVTKCTTMSYLYCYNNRLTALDVTKCTTLTSLECQFNPLTVLDITKCTVLMILYCHHNQLTVLDITKCTELRSLGCYNNQLTALDVTKCTELTELDARNQTIILAEAPTTGDILTIANPITFNGSEVADISGAEYSDGNITWSGLAGANGNAQFAFSTELPDRVGGEAFSGTVTQPWVNSNPSIVVEEPDPVGEDGKGSLDFSLKIPTDATITGTFEIQLPEGYTLDESATRLVEALAGQFDLIITFKERNVWQIEIRSNGLRAATTSVLTKIMDIAYTVDVLVPEGKYNIKINHIKMDLSDGTSIHYETITVITEVAFNDTGIDDLQAAPRIWSANGQVHILLTEATNVQIVNIIGVTVYKKQLPAGTHSVALSPGVYVVKAGTTGKKIKN